MSIRAVRLPLLLLLDVMWGWALVAVLAQLFSAGNGVGPSVLSVAAVVLGSYGLMWALRRTALEETELRIAGVAATVLAMMVIIPLEFGVSLDTEGERGAAFGGSIGLIALWVRGVLRARVSDDFDAAAHSALLGVIPVALATGLQSDVRGPEAFGALAIAYVLLAMLVLALYNAGEPGRPVTALAGEWGGMAAGIVGGAVALALIAAVLDPNSFGTLQPVGDALRRLGTPIEFVLGPPFRFIEWLFSLIPLPSTEQNFESRPPPEEPPREEPEEQPWSLPIRWIMTGIVIAAIVAGVLLLLALIFGRFRRKDDDDDDGDVTEREGGLGEDFGDLLAMLRRPFRRTPRSPGSAYAIRRLYTEMLYRAAADGFERAPGATPSQFESTLAARYGSDLSAGVTSAFVASRYGSIDISDDQVRRLNEQWRQITQQRL